MPQLGHEIGKTPHRVPAGLTAIAAHVGRRGHDREDIEAPRPAAGDRNQRVHFMDIGLPRSGTPLRFLLDRADALEIERPVGAEVVGMLLPELLVFKPLGLSSFASLAAKPISPLPRFCPTVGAVLRSCAVLRSGHEALSAPLVEAGPSADPFCGFGACIRVQSRLKKQAVFVFGPHFDEAHFLGSQDSTGSLSLPRWALYQNGRTAPGEKRATTTRNEPRPHETGAEEGKEIDSCINLSGRRPNDILGRSQISR